MTSLSGIGGSRCSSIILGLQVRDRLIPPHLELVPQLNEVYELELAFYESQVLSDDEIVRNGAYFAKVRDRLTRHFLMCGGQPVRLPQHSSSRLRSFFASNQFKTGYATHGLFPYRGKFHPQMVKGLINVMGLKPGEAVLDPMMGSGTVLIEATLMGVNSVGLDPSPFCCFMARAKLNGLTVPLAPLREAARAPAGLFEHFRSLGGPDRRRRRDGNPGLVFPETGPGDAQGSRRATSEKPSDWLHNASVYNLLLLAYLDSAGYAERSARRSPYEQFRGVLERYLFVTEKARRAVAGIEGELGRPLPIVGDARSLPLADSSVHGVIFSPPYSFAIDYLENDLFHLRFFGVDVERLRERMIGLRGRTLRDRVDTYKRDMDSVLAECARVLRPGRLCTIIVGTNSNQLSRILGSPPEEVPGIDEMLIELAAHHGLQLLRKIGRQITGMANTMRSEFIVMLGKV